MAGPRGPDWGLGGDTNISRAKQSGVFEKAETPPGSGTWGLYQGIVKSMDLGFHSVLRRFDHQRLDPLYVLRFQNDGK